MVTRNWYENIGFITIMYILKVLWALTVINIRLSWKEHILLHSSNNGFLFMVILHLNSRQSSLRSSWKIMTKFQVCQLMCCKKMTTGSPCSSCNFPSASSVVSYSCLLSCDFRFSILYKFIYKYRPCSWKKATGVNKVTIFQNQCWQ